MSLPSELPSLPQSVTTASRSCQCCAPSPGPGESAAFVSPAQASPKQRAPQAPDRWKSLQSRPRAHVRKILLCQDWVQLRSRKKERRIAAVLTVCLADTALWHSADGSHVGSLPLSVLLQSLQHRDDSVTVQAVALLCRQVALDESGFRPHFFLETTIEPSR